MIALGHAEWMAEQFDSWPHTLEVLRPSEWAERARYLPPSVTPMPGYFRFAVVPYMREILDCLSIDSPVRELAVMKGVQVTATTAILENAIGYYLDHVKTAPVMMVTADAELAKLRMEANVLPMIQASGLDHLIKSSDDQNPRKTGRTDRKLEWLGGGYLIPFGAQNANKLRSTSIQIMLRDEIDGWPDIVGKDGDPIELTSGRTKAYEARRKILDLSTPLLKGSSKIERRYLRGDQRIYFVRCLSCGFPQELRWRTTNRDTGEIAGIVWETQNGVLVAESVRYACVNCGHAHSNDDKTRLLSPDNGAEWRPTAEPVSPDVRSYHLSALYSPVGMQSWPMAVQAWLDAWDDDANRPKDLGLLQVFYNNVLGRSFELRGEKLRFESVSQHRRSEYVYGQVPNGFAGEFAEGPIAALTCAVDVHADNLAVAVVAWARGRRAFLVDYWRLEGDTDQLDDPDTWGRLREIIETKRYTADDGQRYLISLTLVDAGYRTDHTNAFCSRYSGGVFPISGRAETKTQSGNRDFALYQHHPMGLIAYGITVDRYKDRWSAALRRAWNGHDLQPEPYFNAPADVTDKQLKELTAETKREKIEKTTGKRVGWEWYRPSGVKNELWDLLIYNSAALDILAWDVCRNQLELDAVNWTGFFDLALNHKLYFARD